jgi:hypothetical protein
MVKVIVVHGCSRCPFVDDVNSKRKARCMRTGKRIPKTGYEKSCPLPNLLEPEEKEEG